MKISQLKSLIKESIKEVLKEKQISTVSLLNENYRNSEENLDVLIKLLNKRKIASAIELIQNVKDNLEDNNLENAFDDAVEEFFDTGNRGIFYDSSGRNLNENSLLDPKLAGYWVLKSNNQAISMYPSKQEAEMAFKNRGTKYGSHALNSNWKIVPAEEFVSTTNGVLDKNTTGHPNYVSPYRRPNKEQDRLDNIARSNREMER